MTERRTPAPPRTLFVAERFPPRTGGDSRTLGAALQRFPAEGTVVFTRGHQGARPVDRTFAFPVRRAWRIAGERGIGLRLWRMQVDWAVRRARPQVVVASGAGADGTIALDLHRGSGVPFVLRLDAPQLVELRTAISSRGNAHARALVDSAAAIVVPSRTARLEARKLHARPQDIEEIAPGVDLETFRPGAPDAAVRGRIDAGRGPVLLTVTDGDPAVDPETILRAFAQARTQLRRAVLVAVGLEPRRCSTLLNELRIRKAVRFLPLRVAELPELYRAADLFLTAHAAGPDAVQADEPALIEALASGVPIAAVRTPATVERVPENEAGVLTEPGAHVRLGRAAADLLRSDELRAEMALAGRALAEEKHDVRQTAARLRELLEVILVRRLGTVEAAEQEPSGQRAVPPAA